jgi:hypothetical protein
MDVKFTWSTTGRGEKAILYNNYLYRLKRENKNGSLIYLCTFKSCSRILTLKDNVLMNPNGEKHNHDPKLSENVQDVLCGLKRRIITDIDQPITKIYDDKVKNIQDDIKLISAKKLYIHDSDFDAYQKVLRSISHRYIKIIKDAKDSSDEE